MSKGFSAPNYTQVPNALIALMPDMRESELKVTLAIARQTFGWHKSRDIISLSQLELITGLSRPSVLNGLGAAIERGIVERSAATHRGQSTFSYHMVVKEIDHLSEGGSKESLPLVVKNNYHPAEGGSKESLPTKENNLKEKRLKKKDTPVQEQNTAMDMVSKAHLESLKGKSPEETEYFTACLAIYKELRLPNWADHMTLSPRAKGQLRELRRQYGITDMACQALRAALVSIRGERFYRKGKFSLDNLGSNSKFISEAEKLSAKGAGLSSRLNSQREAFGL